MILTRTILTRMILARMICLARVQMLMNYLSNARKCTTEGLIRTTVEVGPLSPPLYKNIYIYR